MSETEPGFFDQRNPKSSEPAEILLNLGEGVFITYDGETYKVTRSAQVHVNHAPSELKPAVEEMLPVEDTSSKSRSRR